MNRGIIAAVLAACSFACAGAEEPDDTQALLLADKAKVGNAKRSSLRLFGEAELTESTYGGNSGTGSVTSVDMVWSPKLNGSLNFVFADRFDYYSNVFPQGEKQAVNTLREMYFDWHPTANTDVGLGRINVRSGVARGYNPTDYFRRWAVRSYQSVDPDFLRYNRLGVFTVTGKVLWDSGSASAYFVPKLADEPNTSTFSLDAGATNGLDQGLFSVTQEVFAGFKPQLSVLLRSGTGPQVGLNMTTLLGNSTVAYAEWSGGNDPPMNSAAFGLSSPQPFTNRLDVGLNYTTENKISLTAEYVYNGSGFSAGGWHSLQSKGAWAINTVLTFARDTRDPPSKQNWFFHAVWKDALVSKLDLSGIARLSLADDSNQYWIETRYHWSDRSEVYLQYQHNQGNLGSVYGSTGIDNLIGIFLRHYFL
jgi:hypothetical protein